MKGQRERKAVIGSEGARSGWKAWLACGVAVLFLSAAAALLYGWVEVGRQKPVLRPVATAEALFGALPRTASPFSFTPSGGEEEGGTAAPAPEVAGKLSLPREAESRDQALAVGLFRSQTNRIGAESMLDDLSLPYYHKKKWRVDQTHLLTVSASGTGKLSAAADALAAAGYEFERMPSKLTAYFFDDEEARDALAAVAKAGAKGSIARKKVKAPRWAVYCGPLTEEEADTAAKRLAGKGVKALRARYEP